MLSFDQSKKLFDSEQINDLIRKGGIYFLLLRTLSRREHLEKLASSCNIEFHGIRANDLFRKLYDSQIAIDSIKRTIKEIYEIKRSVRRANETTLISELYKLRVFDWGGLYQNNLEQTIINNYVKKN